MRFDEISEEKINVFYGYFVLGRDFKKFVIGKRVVKWICVSKQDVFVLDGFIFTVGVFSVV